MSEACRFKNMYNYLDKTNLTEDEKFDIIIDREGHFPKMSLWEKIKLTWKCEWDILKAKRCKK